MKPYSRADRVGIKIQRALSEVLKKRVKDPRLTMTIISGVKMSRDLRNARIFFVATGGEAEREAAIKGFEQARGFLKRYLAQTLELRYMPELKFNYDESYEHGTHIEHLLSTIQVENETDTSPVDE